MVLRGAAHTVLFIAAQIWGGCGASLDPIQVASGCPERPIRGPQQYADEPADLLISNFETGTKLALVGGRDGEWVEGSDLTSASQTFEVSPRCVADGRWSGHFMGRGFTTWGLNWTAVFRALLRDGTPVPYDGSSFTAISFWAAFGAGNGPDFQVPVGITTMDTYWNSSECSKCTDHYMVKVPMTHDWQRFVVSFANMTQSGRGDPLLPMRRDQMVGFIIWPDRDFDIWIDDVRFER
jgi:hypothetical protein